MDLGEEVVIDRHGLDVLIGALRARGFSTVGPVEAGGAIVHRLLEGVDDLPAGRHDSQAPGHYRLERDEGPELFGWAVGPASPKSEFFAPHETLWRATVADGEVALSAPEGPGQPVALVGARPCEVRAMGVLDRVLGQGAAADDRYLDRRRGAFVVAAECGSPSGTCFCASMGSGPEADAGVDLALTELLDGGHRFLVRMRSAAGAEVMAEVPHRRADDDDRRARREVLAEARRRMGRSLDTDGLPSLLARNLDHPRWGEVAERCLSCGNCTLVCPTCFCSDVHDVTDVTGAVERRRHWASCFDLEHSYIHGGAVRPTTASRYRQWLTHKLSTWWDQFGESGCVGCGRCITWCPVGIDLTEEAAAIRATDGAVEAGVGR